MAYWIKANDSTYLYKVRTVFYRYNSWTNVKDTSQYLLAHEQLHFDIAELYTRKMRKAIKELGVWTESSKGAYNTLIEKMYSEHIIRQNEYDKKTVHGTVRENQLEWSNKIHAELEALKEYASTPKDCAKN